MFRLVEFQFKCQRFRLDKAIKNCIYSVFEKLARDVIKSMPQNQSDFTNNQSIRVSRQDKKEGCSC